MLGAKARELLNNGLHTVADLGRPGRTSVALVDEGGDVAELDERHAAAPGLVDRDVAGDGEQPGRHRCPQRIVGSAVSPRFFECLLSHVLG